MIIVAGIARSGLTATMQMLEAGGYPCAGPYPAFEPYDIGEIPWSALQNTAVKAVDVQLQFPPIDMKYKVILLRRDLKQQAKSINKFLYAIAGLPPKPIPALVKGLKKDYKKIWKWAETQNVLRLEFDEVIRSPKTTAQLLKLFTGFALDIDKAANVIIERDPACHERLFELDMI